MGEVQYLAVHPTQPVFAVAVRHVSETAHVVLFNVSSPEPLRASALDAELLPLRGLLFGDSDLEVLAVDRSLHIETVLAEISDSAPVAAAPGKAKQYQLPLVSEAVHPVSRIYTQVFADATAAAVEEAQVATTVTSAVRGSMDHTSATVFSGPCHTLPPVSSLAAQLMQLLLGEVKKEKAIKPVQGVHGTPMDDEGSSSDEDSEGKTVNASVSSSLRERTRTSLVQPPAPVLHDGDVIDTEYLHELNFMTAFFKGGLRSSSPKISHKKRSRLEEQVEAAGREKNKKQKAIKGQSPKGLAASTPPPLGRTMAKLPDGSSALVCNDARDAEPVTTPVTSHAQNGVSTQRNNKEALQQANGKKKRGTSAATPGKSADGDTRFVSLEPETPVRSATKKKRGAKQMAVDEVLDIGGDGALELPTSNGHPTNGIAGDASRTPHSLRRRQKPNFAVDGDLGDA